MSDKKNTKVLKEKADSQSPPPSRSPAQRQRIINEEASGSNLSSDIRQSPRLLDRMTDGFGGARPKTSISVGKEKSKESKTEANPSPKKYKSAVSVADKFKASQTQLASSSCSSLDSSEELDSDNQGAGNSSGKSAASNSPQLQNKSKSRMFKTATASLKNLFKMSPKRKVESELNLIESEETNKDMEDAQKTVGKIKKKKAQKFNEYRAVAGNFSRATLGKTPSPLESDRTCITELDSESSSPEKEISRLQIDQRSSRSRDAIPSTSRRSSPNPRGSSGGKHEPRATQLRDESKQKRREAASPYSSPVDKCRCKDAFHRTPGCPIMRRKKEIHNRKKGLGPPRRKSKSPSPKRN